MHESASKQHKFRRGVTERARLKRITTSRELVVYRNLPFAYSEFTVHMQNLLGTEAGISHDEPFFSYTCFLVDPSS